MLAAAVLPAQSIPENMGSGLRELVGSWRNHEFTLADLHHSRLALNPQTRRHMLVHTRGPHILVDTQHRVMARILLDGSLPMSQMRRDLRAMGAAIVADDAAYRKGAAEAYIPLDQAEAIALMPGVAAVNLIHSPLYAVGAVTTQGAQILHSDQANSSGVTGHGITVGILSDSFNVDSEIPPGQNAIGAPINAFQDVMSGDIPNIGVPDGRPGLKFLSEGSDGDTDEGRAIAQIVYDMAPSVNFCFSTVDLGPLSFAASIRRLRTDSACQADILVDDVNYFNEPAFSDGPIAQAVDDVATSTTLAGKQVAYFSAAGNYAGNVYSAPLNFVADADARAMTGLPIDLTTIPSTIDTSGGFHNFNSNITGTPIITQSVSVSQSLSNDQTVVTLQWDDPFDVTNGITTSLSLLVFDSTGKFLGAVADNNFTTREPIQGPVGVLGNFNYKFAIARSGRGSHLATRVFLFEYSPFGALVADYLDPRGPAIFGHPAAHNAIAVGAYTYDNFMSSSQFTPELEVYSSGGPFFNCCDSSGNRLSATEVRQKPEVSGVDGVSNTFFGTPDFGDPFYSFPGTSAAVPHIAGIAALLLDAAGGPGSLTVDHIRSKLIASTGSHDLDPFFSQAVLGDGNVVINLSAHGGDNQGGPFGISALTDPKFFNLQFVSPNSGQTLSNLSIDLSGTGLFFNINARTGFRMTTGASSDGVTATSSVSGAASTVLTLTIAGLQGGGFMQFGVGRSQLATRTNGYSADLLAGAKVTVTLANPAATFTGTFVNKIGTGYGPGDGWGLVDAVKAIQAP